MRLAEPAIPNPSTPSAEIPPPAEPLQRFDTLWKCLLSATDFFDTLLSFHPNQLPGLPTSIPSLDRQPLIGAQKARLCGRDEASWRSLRGRRHMGARKPVADVVCWMLAARSFAD
ncbi:hypothetical protein CCMA1212_006872 [Trichoderma ghanense]|uniref:Uncharacterized protein n=1 Tax=Trichoderma ghanense TaxID=65468 RepID=A0ABY2H0M0_9HYPO